MNSEKFFRKSDWIACWATFIVSLIVYTITLQPTVGLEDSGELIVASDYLGVPHPPGYPSWSLLTWLFQWIFHGVTFHGHPNPAWAVNFFSAFSGAAACGVIALLISRSGMDLLRNLAKESSMLGEKTESLFCAVAGISGGLLLAFGQGMWSQSVIAEVYSLNIFFQSLVLVFLYRWISAPKDTKWLIICAFVFGLGCTNHQTLLFMGLAIAIAVVLHDLELFRIKNIGWLVGIFGALIVSFLGIYYNSLAVLFLGVLGCIGFSLCIRQPQLARDFIITGSLYLVLLGMNKWAAETEGFGHFAWDTGPAAGKVWYKSGFWIWSLYAVLVPLIATFALPRGKVVGPTFLVLLVGLAFYLYMPISSDQNPPINWGYPRTWQGFMHAITRGQYEQVKLAHVFSLRFLQQVGTYLMDLRSQFYWPIALLGLAPFVVYPVLGQTNGHPLSFKGRIRRFDYFFWIICWSLLIDVLALLLMPYGKSVMLPLLVICYGLIAIPTVKRLHDIGLSGHFFWLALIPTLISSVYYSLISIPEVMEVFSKYHNAGHFFFVALIMGTGAAFNLYLLIRRGKTGINAYGEDPLEVIPPLENKCWAWILITLVAFVSVGIVFMILQNPKTDIQNLFIGRVQYIQSHAIYVLWLGYGILLIMAYLETLVKNNPFTKVIGVILVLLLPFALIYKNFHDKDQFKVYGGAEQGGHDFGWQFGNWQLQGVKGIEEDLRAWYSPEEFEKIWAEYPNKNYPEPMGPNAIFFGGTDPGRFVPTYMIYSAKVRPDVYLITQNALADNTYMNVMRDLYGDQIWIPSPWDSNMAFMRFQREGGPNANDGGRIQVQGVENVMKINGYLSEMIFEHNQYLTETKTDEKTRPVGSAVVYENPEPDAQTGLPPERTFYVEESYPMQWMYPYLTPHGLIMKVNNKPTQISQEMIKNDTEFWNWYCQRLLGDKKFMRDVVARKSFSKLRSSIASLYAARGMNQVAEAAFRQAVALYDLSPESNYRLSELMAREGRFDESIDLFNTFLEKDPNNEQAAAFRDQMIQRKSIMARQVDIEKKLNTEGLTFPEYVELAGIYFNRQQVRNADMLMVKCLNEKGTTPQTVMQIAQLMAQKQRLSVVEQALRKYTTLEPQDIGGWLNLASLQMMLKKHGEMWKSIDQAMEIDPDKTRSLLRNDQRFGPVRNTDQFKARVPSIQGNNMNLIPSAF